MLDKKLQAFERRNSFYLSDTLPFVSKLETFCRKIKVTVSHVHVFRITSLEAIFVKQPLRVTCSIDQVFRFVRKSVRLS